MEKEGNEKLIPLEEKFVAKVKIFATQMQTRKMKPEKKNQGQLNPVIRICHSYHLSFMLFLLLACSLTNKHTYLHMYAQHLACTVCAGTLHNSWSLEPFRWTRVHPFHCHKHTLKCSHVLKRHY